MQTTSSTLVFCPSQLAKSQTPKTDHLNMSDKPEPSPTSFLTPPPLQVLIPSVKLDYSHVKSRCGSLDRRGYSAAGGNVSLVLQVHCLCVPVVFGQCFVFFT